MSGPTIVQQANAVTTVATATPNAPASFSALPTAGNAVIVVVKGIGSGGEPHATALVDNQGNTYTQIKAENGVNVTGGLSIWWSPSITAPSGTFTVTATMGSFRTPPNDNSSALVELYEAPGLAGTVDVANNANDGGTAGTTTTLTNSSANTSANDLVIGAIITGNNDIVGSMGTPATGYTTLLTTDSTSAFASISGAGANTAFKVVSAIETSSITWNWNVGGIGDNSFFNAVLVSFAGAGSIGAALAGAASDTTSATGALTASAAPFAPIPLNSGSNQINLGSGANTGTGDPMLTAFEKVAQDFASLNTMVAQLFPTRSIQTPVTGFSIIPPQGVTELVLNPAGTLAVGTLTMPANPGDQQPFEVMTSQQITTLTHDANAGQILNAPLTTMAANTSAKWIWEAPLGTWFRQH